MAKCAVCGKIPSFGSKISFAGNHVKRARKPNLQKVNVVQDGRRVKLTVCTRCIKAGKVIKGRPKKNAAPTA